MRVQCAVCESGIEDTEAFATFDLEGDRSEVHHLCSARCLEAFEYEPERYRDENEVVLEAS